MLGVDGIHQSNCDLIEPVDNSLNTAVAHLKQRADFTRLKKRRGVKGETIRALKRHLAEARAVECATIQGSRALAAHEQQAIADNRHLPVRLFTHRGAGETDQFLNPRLALVAKVIGFRAAGFAKVDLPVKRGDLFGKKIDPVGDAFELVIEIALRRSQDSRTWRRFSPRALALPITLTRSASPPGLLARSESAPKNALSAASMPPVVGKTS